MRATELVGHQIVYLDYVLEGGGRQIDAELLRPIWDNLRHLLQNTELPSDVIVLAGETLSQISQWIQVGSTLSRDSLERVRSSLTGVLERLRRESMPYPGLA